MPPRLPPLLDVPIAFAHRGARAHAPENTIESFRLALRLGATGLESDVWITADGEPVLDHDGAFGPRLRRRQIADLRTSQLPSHMPTLAEFYDSVTTSVPFSLDVKDPAAFDAVVAVARNAGAEHQLWLCHPTLEQLLPWRHATEARLVDSTRLSRIAEGIERRAHRLRDTGIDAINLRHMDWSGGAIAMFHRFERYALGWDAQHPREIANLLDAGIDGVFSDHSDRLAAQWAAFYPDHAESSDAHQPNEPE
ncbi:MAG: glycerophosphodiester phosphodiesterase [Acidimicrobiales bacterium]